MRILFVGFASNIHTARWLSQLKDTKFECYLFPSDGIYAIAHPEISSFKNLTVLGVLEPSKQNKSESQVMTNSMDYKSWCLAEYIQRIKPDIIHSMEFQSGCYLTMKAKKKISGKFPFWIVSPWGSDIYLFGRLSDEQDSIIEVLNNCDYYKSESKRDIMLARLFGFLKESGDVFPSTSGFDIKEISLLRHPGKISERRLIMLKGYQGWAGRSLVGIRALERCRDILNGYEVCIYLTGGVKEVNIAVELFRKTGISIKIIPGGTSHKDILRYHGSSRISIGLSISDGLPNSLLEAMAMGSFPIQSHTSCANEWIKNGINGLLVHPDDPDDVERAIRKSLADDDLVNKAYEINSRITSERLEFESLKNKTVSLYKRAFKKAASDTGNELIHQSISRSDLPDGFNIIILREILFKCFWNLFKNSEFNKFLALKENLLKIIETDRQIKDSIEMMESIISILINNIYDCSIVDHVNYLIENTVIEKNLLPDLYRVIARSYEEKSIKISIRYKFLEYSLRFETVMKNDELSGFSDILNNAKTIEFFESLKNMEPNTLKHTGIKIQEAFKNLTTNLEDEDIKRKIIYINNVVLKNIKDTNHETYKKKDCGILNTEDYNLLVRTKKTGIFNEFILFVLFYLSRKNDLDSFNKVNNCIVNILQIDECLNRNTWFLSLCVVPSFANNIQDEILDEVMRNIKEKKIKKEFIPLFWQLMATRYKNSKEKYISSKLAEFTVKLDTDSFPFNEYDFINHPDDFINYINSTEMQIFLLEKELLNAASNEEILVIQGKIQQLYRKKYNIISSF